MKRIIELPDKVVEAIQNGEDYRYDIHTAIAQSTPYNPSGDCISREALKEAIQKCEEEPNYQHDGETWQNGLYMAETLIDNAPPVDLWQMRQEATENALKKAEVLYGRTQGEWKKDNIGIYCSVCKRHLDVETPFCPLCGADMKGGAE